MVVIARLAGYAFAWIDFPGRDGLFLVVVALLVVPVQVALIPVAELYGNIGIFGDDLRRGPVPRRRSASRSPSSCCGTSSPAIPRELLEAARHGRRQRDPALPAGRAAPRLARRSPSLAIFQFLWVWNDLLVALVFANPESPPLTVAIRSRSGSSAPTST